MPSSTDSDMNTEIGDQAWDDEELARAMALSLQEASPPTIEPAEGGTSGLDEDLLHLLPRADGYSPLSASQSPQPAPSGPEEVACNTDRVTAHAGSTSDGAGRAGVHAPEPTRAPPRRPDRPAPSPPLATATADGGGAGGFSVSPTPVDVPSVLRPYVCANPITGGADTHNKTIVVSLRMPQPCPKLVPFVDGDIPPRSAQDAVLREVEEAGSEFSGEVVRKTMDAMLESGKVLPVRGLETIVCSGPSETYSYSQVVRAAFWREVEVCIIMSWYL
eukprot:COSAG02_NODE_1409_length_12760_cov_27.565911_1_plen_275_part_00